MSTLHWQRVRFAVSVFFVLQNRRYLGSRCCEYETVGASHGLAPFTQPFVSFKSVTHLHTLESLGQALPHDAGERCKDRAFSE